MNRRSYLSGVAAIAAVGTAGCVGGSTPTATPESFDLQVTVQNEHDRAYDARVYVTDAENAVVFDQSFRLRAGEGRGFSDDFPAGQYTVHVELDNRGELIARWDTDVCDVEVVRARIDNGGRLRNEVICTDRTPTPTSG